MPDAPVQFECRTVRASAMAKLGVPGCESVPMSGRATTASLEPYGMSLPAAEVARLGIAGNAPASAAGLLVEVVACGRTGTIRVNPEPSVEPLLGNRLLAQLGLEIIDGQVQRGPAP